MSTKASVVCENRSMWTELQQWKNGQRSFVRRPTPKRVIEADDEAARAAEVLTLTKAQIREDTHAVFQELDEWQQGRRTLQSPFPES